MFTKKSILTLFAALLVFAGCSSVDTAKIKDKENVAVTLISVDQYIDMTDVQSEAMIAQRILDDDSFDLTPMADQLRNNVFGRYQDRLPNNFLAEERVIDSDRYQSFRLFDNENFEDRFKKVNVIAPEGYKHYKPIYLNASMEKRMLKAIPDEADAMMFASIDYEFKEDSNFLFKILPFGTKQAVVKANLYMEMFNEEGDTIMKIHKSASSDNKMNMVGGISVKPDKIQDLCAEASRNVFEETDQYLKEEL
jgi:hypothetical protein